MIMKVRQLAVMTAVCAMMLCAGAANAQGTEESTAPGGALNPLNWRMPQWKMPTFSGILPKKEETMRIKKKKDGLFDEVSKTASSSWQRTKQAFSPKNLNPVRFLPASAKTPSPAAEKKSDPGFFQSIFGPRPQTESPQTVTDFLGQPKPKG